MESLFSVSSCHPVSCSELLAWGHNLLPSLFPVIDFLIMIITTEYVSFLHIKWLECPESGQDVEINITNIVRSGNPTADQWLIVNQSSINTGVCCPFFVISWHHHFLEALKNLNCIFCYLHPFWQSISILGNSNFLCPWFPASVSHELILFYVAHYHNKFRSHCNT